MNARKSKPLYIYGLYRAAKNLAVTLREWTGPDLDGLHALEEEELQRLEAKLLAFEKRNPKVVRNA